MFYENIEDVTGAVTDAIAARGMEPVVETVGRDDVRVVLGRGVDVVVVSGHPGLPQRFGFLRPDLPERDADFHAERRHAADDVKDVIKALGSHPDPLPCRPHAEPGRAGLAGREGAVHHGLPLHEALGFHVGIVAGGLRAIRAVLRTAARLDRQERAQLDRFFGPVLLVHGPGLLEKIKEGKLVESVEFSEFHENQLES